MKHMNMHQCRYSGFAASVNIRVAAFTATSTTTFSSSSFCCYRHCNLKRCGRHAAVPVSLSQRAPAAAAEMMGPRILLLLFVAAIAYAVPYSKYGRNCRDVVCLPSEECVLRTDPCVGDRPCGRYPTCQTASRPRANETCSDYRCPRGQYCTMRETHCLRRPCTPEPTCVTSRSSAVRNTPSPWYSLN
ncbi:Uncharacterized protein GBIM_01406 [Gryllus bimaculatus]|nr:Uncharacterized protein GBIM_01406 [Gryllus bimaculatus]